MQRTRRHQRIGIDWTRLMQQIIYLPGALVLLYGFWLSLSA